MLDACGGCGAAAGVSDNSAPASSRELYVDLLKRCVANSIYNDDLDLMRGAVSVDLRSGKLVTTAGVPVDPRDKHMGQIWPSRAHTMIGIPRLDNLQSCVEQVLADNVPGDLIETGVWRGGAAILMRGILKAHGTENRRVWAADSFEGLPRADKAKYPKESDTEFHRFGQLAVSLEEVRGNFARYGLLDDQVRFLKGWFRDTLPSVPVDQWALIRLDGDMYESTMDSLVHLYPKLSPGGFVIIDDYNAVESCNLAVNDYRTKHDVRTELLLIPGMGAYWRKE